MILKSFFKPKWQHINPDIRIKAIDDLSAENDEHLSILENLVIQDSTPAVRIRCLEKLTQRPHLLETVATRDSDTSVSSKAANLLVEHLLAQPEERQLPLLKKPHPFLTPEKLALHSKHHSVKLLAIEKIDKLSILEQIALSDEVTEIRLAALDKIEHRPALERIIKQCRTQNKKITQAAKEKLKQIVALENLPLEVARLAKIIIEQLTHSVQQGYHPLLSKDLERCQTQWDALAAQPEKSLEATYFAQKEQALALLKAHQETEQQRQRDAAALNALFTQKEALLEQLQKSMDSFASHSDVSDEAIQKAQEAFDSLTESWNTLITPQNVSVDIPPALKTCNTTWKTRCQTYMDLINKRRAIPENLEKYEQLTLNIQRALELKNSISLSDTASLLARATQLSSELEQVCPEQHRALQDLTQQLQQRNEQIVRTQEQLKKSLPEVLKQFEKSLADGDFNHAQRLGKKLRSIFEAFPHPSKSLTHRYQQARAKLLELENWCGWATTPKREALCNEMEHLAQLTISPEEKAKQIKDLQSQWKELGTSEPRSSHALWERFQQAAHIAYEPCKVYNEEQAQWRHENLKTKEALCSEIEEQFQLFDPETADFKALDQFIGECRKRWKTSGPVNRKEMKAIHERFFQAIQPLDQLIENWRKSNRLTKEHLISKVSEAAESLDSFEAADVAKSAQREWKQTGPAGYKQEGKLWKQFRDECDRIFAMRQLSFDERKAQHESEKQNLIALCSQMETLANHETKPEANPEATPVSESVDSFQEQIRDLELRWEQASSNETASDKTLRQRFEKARRQARTHLKKREKQATHAQRERIWKKAALCDHYEAHYLMNGTLTEQECSQFKTEWESTGAGDTSLEQLIQLRYDTLTTLPSSNFSGHSLKEISTVNSLKRAHLALMMEIAAETPSPQELNQERMKIQVERLESALKVGKKETAKEVQELEEAWIQTMFVPQSEQQKTTPRFTAARKAFYSGE